MFEEALRNLHMSIADGSDERISLPCGAVSWFTSSIAERTFYVLLDLLRPEIFLCDELKWVGACHVSLSSINQPIPIIPLMRFVAEIGDEPLHVGHPHAKRCARGA